MALSEPPPSLAHCKGIHVAPNVLPVTTARRGARLLSRHHRSQRVWLCLPLLLVVLGRASQAQASVPNCEQDKACVTLYELAKQESKDGHLVEALRLYKSAYDVRADPRLMFSIARLLHRLNRRPEAIAQYQQFIDSPLEDTEQKRKAEQFLAQARQEIAAAPATPPSPPPEAVPPSPSPSEQAKKSSAEHVAAKRPRWRLITGGAAIGAGLLLVGFGGSALAVQGKCVEVPSAPAQTCDAVYTTNAVGGALLGTGAAVVVGGIVLMAWP